MNTQTHPQTQSQQPRQPFAQPLDASAINADFPAFMPGEMLSPEDMLIPELRDKYTLLSVLGRGSQGTVFLAKSNKNGKPVAIKQRAIDSVSSWKAYDLFHREVDTLSKLDMPGIARFYEAAEHLSSDQPGACIVQEYIEGKTLAEMIHSGFRFSLSRIFDFGLQIIELLEALHHHEPQIIHRDIKPSNIIMTPTKTGFQATLIDFGAVANPQIKSGGSTVAGTFGYMPPEQLTGHPTPESDIYALGVMLVTMICGIAPADIPVKDFRLLIDPYLQNVPPQVVAVLRLMTDPIVQNRLTDYNKIIDIFKSFAADKYEVSGLIPITHLAQNEFISKLAQVNDFGQAGNIDLWQQLPEHTPRTPPASYINLSLRNIQETQRPGILLTLIHSAFGKSIFILSIASFLPLIASLSGYYLLIEILVLCFAIPYIFIYIHARTLFIKKDELSTIYSHRFQKTKPECMPYFNALLKNGRRTMATVVDIQQKSIDISEIHGLLGEQPVATVPPAFVIRYKFNPPDDDNPDDLIRTYIASTPPKLSVGDPLPILYLYPYRDLPTHDRKNQCTPLPHNDMPNNTCVDVVSMPFPIPLNDVTCIDRIISFSESATMDFINMHTQQHQAFTEHEMYMIFDKPFENCA